MKLLLLITATVAGLGYCGQAKSECYVHSKIKMTRQSIVAGPTDIQRLVVPDVRGSKCVANYRVYIANQWHTAEGTAVAPTESEACARAMDIGNGHVLAEVEPDKISSDMAMVCSDLPEIRIRKVHIGETIWESETDLHTLNAERPYFLYKSARCRYFTEQSARDHNMITNQGVICKINQNPDSKWQVVDKF
jgi:hypothetical protein